MTLYKKLLLLVAFTLENISVVFLRTCKDFQPQYHFYQDMLSLRLDEVIHTDKGVSLVIVRFFHNKLSEGLFVISKIYLYYFDVLFLINILSIIGLGGVIYGLWCFFHHPWKKPLLGGVVVCLFVGPLLEVIFHPNISFIVKYFILFSSFEILSLYGLWSYMHSYRKNIFLIILFIMCLLSVWMIHNIYPEMRTTICYF